MPAPAPFILFPFSLGKGVRGYITKETAQCYVVERAGDATLQLKQSI